MLLYNTRVLYAYLSLIVIVKAHLPLPQNGETAVKVIIDGQLDTISIKAGTIQINTEPVQIKQLCYICGFASEFLPMFLQSRWHPKI